MFFRIYRWRELTGLAAPGLASLFDWVGLVEINVRDLRTVKQRFGQRSAQFEECELAGPVNQGSQFDCQRTAISYLQDY